MQRTCLELAIERDLRDQATANLDAIKLALYTQDPEGYHHVLFPTVKAKGEPVSANETLENTEGDWDFSEVDLDEARDVLAGMTESSSFQMPISNDTRTELIDPEEEGWL